MNRVDYMAVAEKVMTQIKTEIEIRWKNARLENLTEGARVRINFRRVGTGDEMMAVEVLRGAKG